MRLCERAPHRRPHSRFKWESAPAYKPMSINVLRSHVPFPARAAFRASAACTVPLALPIVTRGAGAAGHCARPLWCRLSACFFAPRILSRLREMPPPESPSSPRPVQPPCLLSRPVCAACRGKMKGSPAPGVFPGTFRLATDWISFAKRSSYVFRFRDKRRPRRPPVLHVPWQ
jgi:hypothetical protein